tara:strand:+ start:238 stop:1665 length:1428 start_codon:yes stop_codon:yes gene_type:complete
MNNETFGMTFQHAICKEYKLESNISSSRIDEKLLNSFIESKVIKKVFKGKSKPIKALYKSKEFTSKNVKRCPHNFLLENNETFSIRTFNKSNKKFAPKIVGQAGDRTFNHFFGDLVDYEINRETYKKFCEENVSEIIPILVDYALISDYTCFFYIDKSGNYNHFLHNRGELPNITFKNTDFKLINKQSDENEKFTIIVKYDNKIIAEFQLHKKRTGYKLRLHRDFVSILSTDISLNNSNLGDSAEFAISKLYKLEEGINDKRLISNSIKELETNFYNHYKDRSSSLFPKKPIKYSGTKKRERGAQSKSGVDFYLEGDNTLSLKTNKNKGNKVCAPEVGQPSPKTFDKYFNELYDGNIDKEKFKTLVVIPEKAIKIIKKNLKFLNECDYILWSTYYTKDNTIKSKLIKKEDLINIKFDSPELISYTNDFTKTKGVTIKYDGLSIGEFQIYTARNSLQFRFIMDNLLSLVNQENILN